VENPFRPLAPGEPTIEEQPKPPLFTLIDPIAKAIALLVGIFYAFGLIISNQYLLSIEASDFGTLQPKCAITGAWSVALVAIAVLPTLIGAHFWSWMNPIEAKGTRANIIAFGGVLIGVGLGVLLSICCADAVISLLRIPAGSDITPFTWELRLSASMFLAIELVIWKFIRPLPINIRRWGILVLGAIGLYAIMAVSQDIGYIYQEVPPSLAGGRPTSATLIFNQSGVAFWQDIGMFDTLAPTKRSVKVEVLLQDEHSFVIRLIGPEIAGTTRITNLPAGLPNLILPSLGEVEERIIILNKSLVDGVITQQESLEPLKRDRALSKIK
jgi:hypothetical protein